MTKTCKGRLTGGVEMTQTELETRLGQLNLDLAWALYARHTAIWPEERNSASVLIRDIETKRAAIVSEIMAIYASKQVAS